MVRSPRMFTMPLTFLQLGGGFKGPGAFDFFLRGGPMGKFVLIVLVLFSLGSWAVILGKLVHFRRAHGQSARFLEAFHRSQRVSEVIAVAAKLGAQQLRGTFQGGYAQVDGQPKNDPHAAAGDKGAFEIASLPALQRAVFRAAHVELLAVTSWLRFLANTAAATPFTRL